MGPESLMGFPARQHFPCVVHFSAGGTETPCATPPEGTLGSLWLVFTRFTPRTFSWC